MSCLAGWMPGQAGTPAGQARTAVHTHQGASSRLCTPAHRPPPGLAGDNVERLAHTPCRGREARHNAQGIKAGGCRGAGAMCLSPPSLRCVGDPHPQVEQRHLDKRLLHQIPPLPFPPPPGV
eukprot:350348-Chlamydomonas_euryale.AAC.3